ncbi:4-hydroxy-3-methylbut-2-enyl diphosphate reductase [Halorhodospira halophila]|uniref:4-hydroxy-3-methylbut-2-enyl diphosphate reductase n=1 Tax=Halorhodospira halophila (strain DSM 244 / SL1) TaxID=349124 RepID=A1WY36_HALHL|nr:4-hydroxy-3-methylbut-2-enyl diphosphate reductase [Halorhodospira halophila]ABM62598.1 4-hydroxy-3-methylbut-2-enyl diphosphate reductase [Halorhodospira halophila SL1]MBK1728278.1 4-hydroxy-3-methylbut-2-enyl diphosphate reductase [Halorhodospira halophila]
MPKIHLANPRGFCAGVDRAIAIVDRALAVYGSPVYVRHEVVHNRFVVDDLRGRGAVFVEELHEVPDGATVIFSAHGVPQWVADEAERRGLQVFDATCPLVTKVHKEVRGHARAGREVVLIGHAGHPEVEGTMGQYLAPEGQGGIYLVQNQEEAAALQVRRPDDLAFVTQTTLSVDDAAGIVEALQRRFPAIQGPRKDDICYATQNRQDAVRALAEEVDLMLVVGSVNSSNSNRLRELAVRCGTEAYLIDGAADLDRDWLDGRQAIGVTAGASAPESTVIEVVEQLRAWGCEPPEERSGKAETVTFGLPKELGQPPATS